MDTIVLNSYMALWHLLFRDHVDLQLNRCGYKEGSFEYHISFFEFYLSNHEIYLLLLHFETFDASDIIEIKDTNININTLRKKDIDDWILVLHDWKEAWNCQILSRFRMRWLPAWN